jgi:hypothetical protein
MKQVMKKILSVALMLMIGMVVKAQVTVEYGEAFTLTTESDVTIASKTGGTVVVKSMAANAEDATSTDVTITVTPASGYLIHQEDVQVYMSVTATTRSVDFNHPLMLTGVEPDDKTAERDYTFTVPEGFGAVVYDANFQSADALYNIGGGEDASSVIWSLNEDRTVMTITGTGTTMDFNLGDENFEDPFETFRSESSTVTTIVIGEGVTSLGANIFKNFAGLTKVTLQNKDAVMTFGENAIGGGVTIDVPGNLYNEYKITDGWSALTIQAVEGSVEMTGLAFDANNSYRTFVSADQALLIPTVLVAYVISGLTEDGTALELAEVADGVIPAGVPVLLMAANSVNDGFWTSTTDAGGTATGMYLKVAPEEGLEVSAGQVYLLYNNQFYFTQSGTLSANRVYLDMREEPRANARGSIGFDSDSKTGIAPIYYNKVENQSGWYMLDGRRLNTAPSRKGIYIKDGKKVVIK